MENPTTLTNFYGYDNDGPMLPAPGNLPSPTNQVEATKTEPDKNTYLVLPGQHGAVPVTTTEPISCSRVTNSV